MNLHIAKCSYEGKWFDFGGARVKVRPYPASKITFAVKDGAMILSGEQTLDKFRHCLEAWEGFMTPPPDNKAIVLTDEVKQKLYDFRLGSTMIDGKEVSLVDFVTSTADEMTAEIRSAEKN